MPTLDIGSIAVWSLYTALALGVFYVVARKAQEYWNKK
jgi:hypothetical protein